MAAGAKESCDENQCCSATSQHAPIIATVAIVSTALSTTHTIECNSPEHLHG
jgi:hypothetical protein